MPAGNPRGRRGDAQLGEGRSLCRARRAHGEAAEQTAPRAAACREIEQVALALWRFGRRGVRALDALRERGLEEAVEIAIEHLVALAGLHARAQVLHDLVGLQHVAADL